MPTANGSLVSTAFVNQGLSSDALAAMVIAIIAEVTRYPRDILQPEADLEEELGIDSVKRAEILAVLRARLELPEAGDGAVVPPRTIGDVVAAVGAYLGKAAATVRTAPAAAPLPELDGRPSDEPEHSAASDGARPHTVVDIIAEVTRYPRDLLKSEADLEEDLGFDVGQRRAIFAALRSRLGLALSEQGPLPAVKTIGDIVSAVDQLALAPPTTEPRPPKVESRSQADRQLSSALPKPFTGKVALVTGSGHGLGKAIAAHLAQLGATVAVNSFHSRQRGEETTAAIVAGGGQAVHLWGSVTNPTHLGQIFGEIDSRFGGLDFFVSNASNGILAPLKEIQPEHWERAFRTNVVGLHQASLLAAESMRRRGGGKIVALSSIGAQRCLDYLGCIGTVKAAVESLVRYLAVELGADNIQVNAVSAGPVYGELMEKYPDLEKLRPLCEALTPRQRLNTEQEVAETVAFLLSNSGMSGSILLLDAGGGQRISVSTTPE
ncbi:MAG: SDR family oxidoreductase [Gemmataceae bacterium]|nr:SDR family oxidoreductase [Gemmataceae bacterium]